MIKILTILKRLFCIILGLFLGIYIGRYMDIFFDPTYQNSGQGMLFFHGGEYSSLFAWIGTLGGGILGFLLPSNNLKTYRIRITIFFLVLFFIFIANIVTSVMPLV